jgi:hypothetical protein
MYVITYKGKPATLDKMHNLEIIKGASAYNMDMRQRDSYLAAPTKQKAIDLYLYHFGYTWKERTAGIHVALVTTVSPVMV